MLQKQLKDICIKGEGTVDHSQVSRWLKKFCSDYKNLNDQARSGGPKKNVDSEAVFHGTKAKLESIRRDQQLTVGHLNNLGKCI